MTIDDAEYLVTSLPSHISQIKKKFNEDKKNGD